MKSYSQQIAVNATEIPQDHDSYMPHILAVIGTAVAGLFGWFGKQWNRKEKQLKNAFESHLCDSKEQREKLESKLDESTKMLQKIAVDSTIAITNCTRAMDENTSSTKANTRATEELKTQCQLQSSALARLACSQDKK